MIFIASLLALSSIFNLALAWQVRKKDRLIASLMHDLNQARNGYITYPQRRR